MVYQAQEFKGEDHSAPVTGVRASERKDEKDRLGSRQGVSESKGHLPGIKRLHYLHLRKVSTLWLPSLLP